MAFKFDNSIIALLEPAMRGLMHWKGSRVKSVQIQRNLFEDTIELGVIHTLFYGHELIDGHYKKFFRERFLEAILANGAPDGRKLIVERRAMIARAQRARKTKPVRVDL